MVKSMDNYNMPKGSLKLLAYNYMLYANKLDMYIELNNKRFIESLSGSTRVAAETLVNYSDCDKELAARLINEICLNADFNTKEKYYECRKRFDEFNKSFTE